MEIIVAVLVVGVLIPVGAWLGDEANGRAGWRAVLSLNERVEVGAGAFRAATVEVSRAEVLRERASWWVRLLALTCYAPLSAAIVSALPWLLGLVVLFERGPQHRGDEASALALLVVAFPFGAWAAVRMAGLGRALLSGEGARFRRALRSTATLELWLNGALLLGALLIFARYRNGDSLLLLVAPALTLLHLGVVGAVGLAQTRSCPSDTPRWSGIAYTAPP